MDQEEQEEQEEPLLRRPSLRTHRSNPLPFSEIEETFAGDPFPGSSSSSSSSPESLPQDEHHPSPPPPKTCRRSPLQRARTAPAIAIIADLHPPSSPQPPNPTVSSSILCHSSLLLLLLYLAVGVAIYSINPKGYSGIETYRFVDALYFCIVTLCTIGYGDIAPITPATKVFSCFFVLVGFGLIDILLSGAVNYCLDLQESLLLSSAHRVPSYIYDAEKGRMRIRLQVGITILVVIVCIGVGAVALIFIEKLDWMDSIYLSVMSVTTVGFGDRAFKTLGGRVFASFWLLISTLAVARAFLFLAEVRINRRHRRIARWVLQRGLTVEDLIAADVNRTGFISKSEFVIYKLKEMGKIGQKDIVQIYNQFKKLDPNNTGKISLPDLLNSVR